MITIKCGMWLRFGDQCEKHTHERMSEPKTDCDFIYRIHAANKQQRNTNKVPSGNKNKKKASLGVMSAGVRRWEKVLRNEQQQETLKEFDVQYEIGGGKIPKIRFPLTVSVKEQHVRTQIARWGTDKKRSSPSPSLEKQLAANHPLSRRHRSQVGRSLVEWRARAAMFITGSYTYTHTHIHAHGSIYVISTFDGERM